jgi:hypothetical protein
LGEASPLRLPAMLRVVAVDEVSLYRPAFGRAARRVVSNGE